MAFDDGATKHDDSPRENLTWEGFGDATRELARQVRDSNWMPDLIVAVARGGLLPAGAVSYALGVKAMGTMNSHSDVEPDEEDEDDDTGENQ